MSLARKASQLALVLSFLMIAVSNRAGEVSLPLKAEKDSSGGSGTFARDDGKIRIRAKGLRPNAVCTVWFVSMNPEKHQAGAGTAPSMFRSDGKGSGSYESPLSESPFGKWRTIMVVRHTTGGPGDMKNMAPALSAGIPKKQERTRRGEGQSSSPPFRSCRPAATSRLDGFRAHVPGGVSGISLKATR